MSPTALLRHCWASWRSVTPRELLVFSLVAGAFLLMNNLELGRVLSSPELPQILARQCLEPLLPALGCMLLLLPVERSRLRGRQRGLALAGITVLATVLAMLAIVFIVEQLRWPSVGDVLRQQRGELPEFQFSLRSFLGGCLTVLVPAGLTVALFSYFSRQRQDREALQALQQQREELQRQTASAQLAALQARLEPRLLFDSLVGIEHAYAHDARAASARMERLIRHLRVALPPLRGNGLQTLAQEAELLDSYLAVQRDLQAQALSFRLDCTPAALGRSLPPMLLLPLLQAALHAMPQAALCCTLRASVSTQGALAIRLHFDAAGLCASHEQLHQLQQRLHTLSGQRGELRCDSSDNATEYRFDIQ
ncbi:histidine kinase [Paucibacter sp. APW11]|uniref:Histidine kinase n=1 Tax=Roseateles aquae TaxID=3077235 RepID=A0ABU3PDP6_9BURK|nr:histidine kinase [Paucibacter sp. APW11]MDT9000689.1 histidine kinase [Paucibacter sp. APW11]